MAGSRQMLVTFLGDSVPIQEVRLVGSQPTVRHMPFNNPCTLTGKSPQDEEKRGGSDSGYQDGEQAIIHGPRALHARTCGLGLGHYGGA